MHCPWSALHPEVKIQTYCWKQNILVWTFLILAKLFLGLGPLLPASPSLHLANFLIFHWGKLRVGDSWHFVMSCYVWCSRSTCGQSTNTDIDHPLPHGKYALKLPKKNLTTVSCLESFCEMYEHALIVTFRNGPFQLILEPTTFKTHSTARSLQNFYFTCYLSTAFYLKK